MCKHPLGRVPLYPKKMRDKVDNEQNLPKEGQQGHKHTTRRGSKPKSHSPTVDNQTCVPLAGTSKRAKYTKADQQNNNTFTTPVKNDNRRYPVRNRRNSEGSHHRTQGKQQQQQSGDQRVKSPSSTSHCSTSPSIPACISSPAQHGSGGKAYAGAKFSDPPSPKVLPRPPIHWVNKENVGPSSADITSVLRVMLKVQS